MSFRKACDYIIRVFDAQNDYKLTFREMKNIKNDNTYRKLRTVTYATKYTCPGGQCSLGGDQAGGRACPSG